MYQRGCSGVAPHECGVCTAGCVMMACTHAQCCCSLLCLRVNPVTGNVGPTCVDERGAGVRGNKEEKGMQEGTLLLNTLHSGCHELELGSWAYKLTVTGNSCVHPGLLHLRIASYQLVGAASLCMIMAYALLEGVSFFQGQRVPPLQGQLIECYSWSHLL